MTLSLYLLRHAKSAWDDAALDDYDRPLAARGRSAAAAMGRWMAQEGLTPHLVLCSTAARAQQTALLAFEHAGWPSIQYIRMLYLASAGGMLDALRAAPVAQRRVMMIGHNPGMEALAGRLAGAGDAELRQRMAEKFPTAAFAQIDFPVERWDVIAEGQGALMRFQTPRGLWQGAENV